jgi:hypothetical protein
MASTRRAAKNRSWPRRCCGICAYSQLCTGSCFRSTSSGTKAWIGTTSVRQIVITGGPTQFLVLLGADKDQVYSLTAMASDLAGNTITQQATCTVTHDKGN